MSVGGCLTNWENWGSVCENPVPITCSFRRNNVQIWTGSCCPTESCCGTAIPMTDWTRLITVQLCGCRKKINICCTVCGAFWARRACYGSKITNGTGDNVVCRKKLCHGRALPDLPAGRLPDSPGSKSQEHRHSIPILPQTAWKWDVHR